MNTRAVFRRLLLVVGLLLVVAGWGGTRYADGAMLAASGNDAATVWEGERTKSSTLARGKRLIAAKDLYKAGFLCIGIGTALVALTYKRS